MTPIGIESSMRILLLSDRIPPQASGAGRVAWSLAVGLQKLGHEVHIVTAVARDATHYARDGITINAMQARIPDRWRAYLSLHNPPAVRSFTSALDAIRPDVVNAHNVHVDLSYGCLTAASRRGYPIALTTHDVMPIAYGKITHYVDPSRCPETAPATYRLPRLHNLRQARFRYNPLRNLWIRRILHRHVDARLAVSGLLRKALEANGLPPFDVVHPGVIADAWDVGRSWVQALGSRLGLMERPVILMAGRIGAAKGSRQALAAMDLVVEQVPDAALLVLSDRPLNFGPYGHLRGTHVIEVGWQTGRDLAAAFRLARAVICPSICLDSFGLVAVEAMAARTPVIASCHGGYVETVLHKETGFLVNPFNTTAFANRIIQVLTNGSLQRRLGEAGYRRYLDTFTAERYARRMEAVFEDMLA